MTRPTVEEVHELQECLGPWDANMGGQFSVMARVCDAYLELLNPAQQKLYEFGKWCLRETRACGGQDIDRGDAQDKLEELGMLQRVIVQESCGEGCWCADWDEFPQECLRYTKDVMEAMG